jgi:hypothetical protein
MKLNCNNHRAAAAASADSILYAKPDATMHLLTLFSSAKVVALIL